MKIVIQKKQLENVLIKSIPFLEAKDNSAITSNISIVLSDGSMVVNATDYEIGLKTTIETMGIIEDGMSIVNGKKLLDIVKILKNDNVTIETKEDTMFISQGRSKFKVSLFSDSEFPLFPSVDNGNVISIDSNVMINSFREITPSIDTNNPKYEFNGALLDIRSDCIKFVSTDIKRLSIVDVPGSNDSELAIIIPRRAILEIQKLFNDDIKIYFNDVYLVIESSSFVFFTKLVNGRFPDYERIIPKDISHSVTLNKLIVVESIKQINTVSSEVQITISNNKMAFSSVGDKNNEAATDIEINYVCDTEINLVVNSKYILDFLSVVFDSEFNISINEENLPFVLQSGDLKTIVMPITA